MIVTALLLSLQAMPAEPVEPVVANEIVVVREKLDTWRGRVRSRDGELTCDVRASTGDAAIDEIGCAALIGCTLEVKPELDAVAALDLPRKERSRRLTQVFERQAPCIEARRDLAIDVLARQRAEAQ